MQLSDISKMKRFRQIVQSLLKYGFDEVVQRMELPGSDIVRRIHSVDQEMGVYERIRCTIEELGPTFIKFGQIMSLRPDLVPEPLLEELEKLQDDLPAFEMNEIRSVIEESLGSSLTDIFSVFDVDPVAAASLSQVHRAVLKDSGDIVAVKIQRPGIEQQIKPDLDILEGICRFLDQNFQDLKVYDLPNLAQVIRSHLIREIDFTIEQRNLKIAGAYAAQTHVRIPQPSDRYCRKKILVMEYIQGARFREAGPGSSYDGHRIARQGLFASVKQILEDGFFHADPHPGNLMVMEDMSLCILDWGMVGRLTERDQFELIGLLKAVVDKDADALVHCLLRLCQDRGKHLKPRDLERDLLEILDTYYAVPIKEMDIGQLLMSITTLIRHHHLRLPTDLVIMIKALVTAEGSARLVYPELDVVSEIKEYVTRLSLRRFEPEILLKDLRHTLSGAWVSQRDVPRKLHQIISKLNRGEFQAGMRVENLERLIHSLDNAASRLTIAIVTAAIIMGSSMIITTGVEPYLFGFPALGVVGYLLSVVLGVWLIITILRNR